MCAMEERPDNDDKDGQLIEQLFDRGLRNRDLDINNIE